MGHCYVVKWCKLCEKKDCPWRVFRREGHENRLHQSAHDDGKAEWKKKGPGYT